MVLENEKTNKLRIGQSYGLVCVHLGLLQSLILKPKGQFGNACDMGGIHGHFNPQRAEDDLNQG